MDIKDLKADKPEVSKKEKKEQKKRELDKEEEEEMMLKIAKNQETQTKLNKWKYISGVIRFLGSIILCLDLVFKIFYYSRSRWRNNFAKDIYKGFLILRPVCIFISVLYNFLIEWKSLREFTSKRDYFFNKTLLRRQKKMIKRWDRHQEEFEGGKLGGDDSNYDS